jgi:hypothetical protein
MGVVLACACRVREEHRLIHDINKSFCDADRAAGNVKKHRIAAGKFLIEASKFVAPGKWGEWCKRYVTRSSGDIRKVMKIAGAVDAEAAADDERKRNAEAQAKRRDNERSDVSAVGQQPSPINTMLSTRSGTEKAVYDRVMFMVERAEDEDQLRMIERHISKVFPELARLASEAGLTGKE